MFPFAKSLQKKKRTPNPRINGNYWWNPIISQKQLDYNSIIQKKGSN